MTDLAPKPRWYRLTPDRVVIGLLVVECLLWLSERFQWFGFGKARDWPVVLAVATVGVAFLVMLLWFIGSLISRWRFQFSIRSSLVLIAAIAIQCSWLAVEMEVAKKQKEAIAEIEKVGGKVEVDERSPDKPMTVQFIGPQFKVAGLEHLKELTNLQSLNLFNTKVTDAGLVHLKGLTNLQLLTLFSTKVTDAGVEGLRKALPKCMIQRGAPPIH